MCCAWHSFACATTVMPIGRGKGAGAHQPVPPGGAKVYVGNLSWETSWQDLKDHMRQAGEVLHADIILNTDGRSKGCGLVTFVNAHDAAGAISTLHDSVLHGRSIFVREDREAALPGLPAPSAGRGAGAPVLPGVAASPARSAPPAVAAEPGSKVFVGNLAFETSWQDLKDHFRQAGEVLHADIMLGPDGRSKGCGLVTFASAHDATNAISTLHDSVLHSRSIFVREDREPSAPAPGGFGGGKGGGRVGGATPTAGCQVFVGNLPWDVAWQVRLVPRATGGGGAAAAGGPPPPACRPVPALAACRPPIRRPLSAPPPAVAAVARWVARGASPQCPSQALYGTPNAPPARQTLSRSLPQSPVRPPNRPCATQALKDHFRAAGNVVHADVVMDADGRSRGFGTVLFATTREAAKAIQLFNETFLLGRQIEVRPDQHR